MNPEFGLAVTGEMDGAGATGRNLGGGNDRVSSLLGCQPSRSLLEEPPSPGNDSSSVRSKTGSQAGTRLHCFHKVEGNGSRRKTCSQSLTSVSVSSSQPDTFLGAEETDGRRPFTPRWGQPGGAPAEDGSRAPPARGALLSTCVSVLLEGRGML